jgi:hypothetical protein
MDEHSASSFSGAAPGGPSAPFTDTAAFPTPPTA